MRAAATTLAVIVGVVVGVAAQAPPAGPAEVSGYRFGGDTGLLVFHVHPERAGDFEALMHRVSEALQTTSSLQRREQAAGWRFFRGKESADALVYVVVLDPVIRDADYDPVKMFTEFMPAEASDLYERLRAAVVRVERVDLERLP